MAKTKIEEFFKSLEAEENTASEQSTEQEQQLQPQQEVQQEVQQEPVGQEVEQQLQPQPVEKPIAGKFSSVDDLIKSYEELQSKFYEVQERLKRAEQGLEAFKSTQTPSVQPVQPVQPQDIELDVDPLVDPKGFAKKLRDTITTSVLQQVNTQIMLQQQMVEVRERFYKLNPDLVGKERLVGLIAQDVAREMPNVPLDTVLEEIAKRTRQFLKSLAPQQVKLQQPVSPTPQQTSVREKMPEVQPIELTEEQELAEYLKQRKQLLQKKKI